MVRAKLSLDTFAAVILPGYKDGIGLPCLSTEVFFQRSSETALADNILAVLGI